MFDITVFRPPLISCAATDRLPFQDGSQAMSALVSVGSTEFTGLIRAALEEESLLALQECGISSLFVQAGASRLPAGFEYGPAIHYDMHVEIVRFTDDIEERMAASEFVLCHAGPSYLHRF